MAKTSSMNLIEQHVEKGVLAVSALVFLVVLFHWGLSSPREIEVIAGAGGGTETVSPGEVDELLQRAASDILRRHDEAEAEAPPPPDYAEKIQQYRSPSLGNYRPGIVFVQPKKLTELPSLTGQKTQVDLASLAGAVPAPAAPHLDIARVLPRKPDPRETWVAHVAAVYPWGQIVSNWDEQLRPTRVPPRVVFLGVEAQVQQRQPNGQWGSPRTVESVAMSEGSGGYERPGGGGTGETGLPNYTGTNTQQVRSAIDSFERTQMVRIMEPEYWPIYWPPTHQWISWRVNLPKTSVSEAAEQAAEREEQPAERGREYDRYDRYDRRDAYREFGRDRFDEAYRRPTYTATGEPAARGADAPPPPTVVPPLSAQIERGEVLVWLHDEGLENRRAYRYRVRLKLLNPLYTWDTYVKDVQDARTAAVYSPYSEWSPEVEVPREVQFFLTGSLPPQPELDIPGRVVVSVFKHSRGQVVRYGFTVSPGERIGGPRKVSVVDPIEGGSSEQAVDFSTGAIAVDFDFDKEVEVTGRTRQTVEMLYLDESGQLRSRVLAMDRDRDDFRELRRAAERAETTVPGVRDERRPEYERDEFDRRREGEEYRRGSWRRE
jgi:hypothetical protein